MSDDEDVSEIPPALTADEWNASEMRRPLRLDGLEVRITIDNALHIGGFGMPTEIRDANDIAAVIALGNELLRRFDDPRAIVRENVTLARSAAERINSSEPPSDSDEDVVAHGEMYVQLHEFADALESYLPPRDQR